MQTAENQNSTDTQTAVLGPDKPVHLGEGRSVSRTRTLRVLFVEDNPDDVELITSSLKYAGYGVVRDVVQSKEEFVKQIQTIGYDIILTDYNLPQWDGMDVLRTLRHENIDIPVVLVTGALGDVNAVECIKQGASDYVLKDNLARLAASVPRALHEQQIREERNLYHEQLAQTVKELARSNHDLEQFAYAASHDLQEPLRMVAAYTQLLAERYKGKLDETAHKYIGYATDGALRMQTLVHDLLAFSRVGHHGGTMQTTDCQTVIDQALKNLESAIQESRASVTSGILPSVVCNGSQLTQVFQNLIGNAIKFRGAAPPVIQVQAVRNESDWLFTVSDNGIGVPAENAQEIFSIFKRLHTRREYPGNGIGLAICKRIIDQHHGKIWVESKEQGSAFKFTLPVTT